MAEVGRLRLETDIGVSITEVVGSDELEGKPVGTMYIGIDSSQNKRTIKGNYPGDRSRVKHWVTNVALFELRKMLLPLD